MVTIRFRTALLAAVLSSTSMLSLAGVAPGLQSSTDTTHPFMIFETAGVTTLAFVSDNIAGEDSVERDMRLKVGRVVAKDDSESALFVKLPEFEQSVSKDVLKHFAWLNYNEDVATPYFVSDSLFVKNIGLSDELEQYASENKDACHIEEGSTGDLDPKKIAEKKITVGELFQAACESEDDAIKKLEEIFSLSSEEAIRALKTSTDPVRCILSPVWLKNTENGSTCELDFQRYNISVEVGHDSGCGNEGSKILDWYDIGVNITVAAPGCGTISGKSDWALDVNSKGAFIRSNTLVGGRTNVNTTDGMRLYAKFPGDLIGAGIVRNWCKCLALIFIKWCVLR
ncbi:MAG: hypothetical protein QS748_01910 [Candidatus Endonucleobacter bathymodioli]|uniref:Uncharacterized protein n=1 Tax=Candidatus Endonucleibacter bathymodioli TaxID=539814 RepID=A0AA90NK58_9GAMM|nr:hypothetical protein [Candidatus Endonucleobacter bathymodioli]